MTGRELRFVTVTLAFVCDVMWVVRKEGLFEI